MSKHRVSVPTLLILFATAATIFCPCVASDAFAQLSTVSAKLNQEVTQYVAAGYSVVGPSQISSVKNDVIYLVSAVKDYPIDLANKGVKVRDLDGNTLSVSSLKPGASVYVYRKGNSVMFRVISMTGGSDVR